MKLKLVLAFLILTTGASLFAGASGNDVESRVVTTTRKFINSPTGLDPLGDGAGVDPKPLFSLKKFDCTTYVETNLAMAFATSEQNVVQELTKIRYQNGKANYFERNHFMVTDWIPANSHKGYVSDITAKLAQDTGAFRTDKKTLNKTIWFYHHVIDLLDQQKKLPSEILSALATVPVLPVREEKATYLRADYFRENEQAIAAVLPDVSIIMFIRNIPAVPTLVNHMGFIIKKDGKLYLNHAPQTKPWKVQEILLDDYLNDMDSHRAPVEGLLFLKIGNQTFAPK